MTRAGSPLFVRIFLVMLVTVGIVQLGTSALLLLAGPPTEAIRTADDVASALRRAPGTYADFKISIQQSPPEGDRAPAFERLVAARLSLPVERIRVVQTARPTPPLVPGGLPNTPIHNTRTEIMIGRFDAAVSRSDGSWLMAVALRRDFEAWRRATLIWLGVALLAITPFAWLIARRTADPVKALAQAAERIGREDNAPPLDLKGPREVVEAAATFNAMQRRIVQQLRERTVLIAAIAHDLRTPLTRLSLRLRSAPEPLRDALAQDIADLEAMVAATIKYVEAETKPIDRRLLDVRSLVAAVVDDAADLGQDVLLEDGKPVRMFGNPVALRALVCNLIANAVRYGGSARVTLDPIGCNVVVAVRDYGPGFNPADIRHAFEPFYRGEASRNRETGGTGLGLAAVRAVARAHGGDATVENSADGGAVVTVTLPFVPSRENSWEWSQ